MKSLFDTHAYEEIKGRLAQLNANSKRQWGKMTAGQMAFHCQFPLKLALTSKPLKRKFNPIVYLFKKSLYNDKPWKKNLPTARMAKVSEDKDFASEKETLTQMVDSFYERRSQEEWHAHPVFGKFTKQQWGQMQYKHLDHHLRQFGV